MYHHLIGDLLDAMGFYLCYPYSNSMTSVMIACDHVHLITVGVISRTSANDVGYPTRSMSHTPSSYVNCFITFDRITDIRSTLEFDMF